MVSIFIVDDEAFLVDLYRDILRLKGHSIAGVAYDGAEAIDKYVHANPKPDVIIMDHRMPVMCGLAALKEILRISPSQKVMFVSADASIEEDVRATGALEFLLKPFRMDDLLERLEHLVEGGRTRPPDHNRP